MTVQAEMEPIASGVSTPDIPTVVGTSSNKGGGNLTVTLDAGLSIVAVCTQAENLPATGTNINNVVDWTCIVGTKGGAGFSDGTYDTGRFLYVFHKVTTAGETITTGDSGVFQVYQAITVSGYNTSTPLESVTTRGRSNSVLGLATIGLGGGAGTDDDTDGPSRLIIGFTTFDKDTNTAFAGTWTAASLSDDGTITAQQTSIGNGGGLAGMYGGFASDSDGGDWGVAEATDATYFLNNCLQATVAVVPAS